MAKIVSSFVTLSERTKKPMKLLKLERHRTRDEEIVNGAVLTRHEILLTKTFTSFPRGPPSKSSVACALRDGANAVCDDHRDVMPPSKFAWSRDEAEKLLMAWRYVWLYAGRSEGSRCLALGRLKACFLQHAKRTALDDVYHSSGSDTEVVDPEVVEAEADVDSSDPEVVQEDPPRSVDSSDTEVVQEAPPISAQVTPKRRLAQKQPSLISLSSADEALLKDIPRSPVATQRSCGQSPPAHSPARRCLYHTLYFDL